MSTSSKSSASLVAGALALALGAAALGAGLAILYLGKNAKNTPVEPPKPIVLRTPGGHLQVSGLRNIEEFGWQTSWTCPVIDCSRLPKTTSRVRFTAVYTYRIALAPEWRLEPTTGGYTLTVPPIELQTPVGIDTSDLKMSTQDSVFSPAAAPNRELLLQKLGSELAARGSSSLYLRAQSKAAEATVREFANKWMQADGRKLDRPLTVVIKEPNPG